MILLPLYINFWACLLKKPPPCHLSSSVQKETRMNLSLRCLVTASVTSLYPLNGTDFSSVAFRNEDKEKKKLVVVAKRKHISGNIRSLIYSWPWISGSVGDYCTSPLPLAALLHRPALPEDDPTSPAVIAHLLSSLTTTTKPAGISYSLSYYTSAGLQRLEDAQFLRNAVPLGAVRAGLYRIFVYRKTAFFVLLFSRHYIT